MENQEACKLTKCRTCFNPARKLQSLTDTIDTSSQQISYADLLEDVANINIKDDKSYDVPKNICGSCLRKLKSSHEFIKQAKEVNEKLWSMINKSADVNSTFEASQPEGEMDINACLAIEMDNESIADDCYDRDAPETEEELKSVSQLTSDSDADYIPLANIPKKRKSKTVTAKSCLLCQKECGSKRELDQHMNNAHGDVNIQKISLTKNKKTHQCTSCTRKYTTKKQLDIHIVKKHNQDGLEEESENKPALPKLKVLPICPICGTSLSSQSELTVHVRRHTGERPYKCDICEKAYPKSQDLKHHIRIHTGEKPFKCTLCEKAFRKSAKLTNHMRSHSDERPYKCTECDSSFKYPHNLNVHKRMHTGARPYACTDCEKTYTQNAILRDHCVKKGHMGY